MVNLFAAAAFYNVTLAYALIFLQPPIAVVGLIINTIGVYDTWVDMKYVDGNGNDERDRLTARKDVEWALFRVFYQICVLVMGLLPIIDPSDPGEVFIHSGNVVVNRSVLIALTVGLTWKTLLLRRYDHEMLRLWMKDSRDQKQSRKDKRDEHGKGPKSLN